MVRRMRRRGTRGSRRGRQRRGRGIVGTVRRVVSRVRQLERTKEETKHLIYTDSFTGGGAQQFCAGHNLRIDNPFVFSINVCSRGDTVQDRTGDHAIWTKIRARIAVYFGTAVVNETWVKWRLICERRPEGNQTSASQYFTNTFGVSQPPNPCLLPNINNKDQYSRYRTLKQGTMWVRGLSDSSVEERVLDIDWYSKGINTSYTLGNGGDVTDIDRNHIYLIIWTGCQEATNGIDLYGEMQAFFHG